MTAAFPLTSALTTDAAWARALYEAWARHGETPIWAAMVAEYGNPLSVEARCS